MKLAEIYKEFQTDIEYIESILERTLSAEHPVLNEASTDLLKAGGKRIRPVLVLLAGKFGNYDLEKLKHIAASLELIHMGSLVHDDVIDNASLRRGNETVMARWDNRVAMYTGDYIFGHAIETTKAFQDKRVHVIISDAMHQMCLGEVEQIRDQYNWDQTIRTYFRRIKRKTALLIAVSSQLGAIAANVEEELQQQMYYFAYFLGMSYQIMDDILDFVGTKEQLGKPAGGDLRQGNVTLPALYAMDTNPSFKEKLRKELTKDTAKMITMEPFLNDVRNSGGIEYAQDLSDRYLSKAYALLNEFPNCEAKTHLKQVAAYIGRRKY
ncbi:heptaprenyl diphosphate synthase component II [Shouchella lehensis]|uniref:Heptaprenyl diphosphate synthase component II n=2 Tax=Shouchella lehensis TaxID=300825 RepID=A0A060LXW8_9BACI|nr:heptaprenyl diphosphate synthase component II [Shouchella lehensis]AIC94610.1 heptaprenyl diphosphate synthase component II [Shouchella lehensis G1]MBG9784500.1 heptaprenyl diphosphate synthase [Shouchella lehensis]RQW20478.1 heptaprenyl diphosphate synthase component II [Bacillus sp. C1-1]TES50494.1 heptaprenyl diphosphate synthase component II [Shouchella lehensis]